MAWIESHQELRDHPKLKRLARALEVRQAHAIGHLHCLWYWALAYAENGDLSGHEDWELAEAADWGGDPAVFIEALRQHGWLDGTELHDWYDYAGKLVERRARDRERKREVRKTSAGHPHTVDSTQPNPTQQTQPNPPGWDRAVTIAKAKGARNPEAYAKAILANGLPPEDKTPWPDVVDIPDVEPIEPEAIDAALQRLHPDLRSKGA